MDLKLEPKKQVTRPNIPIIKAGILTAISPKTSKLLHLYTHTYLIAAFNPTPLFTLISIANHTSINQLGNFTHLIYIYIY